MPEPFDPTHRYPDLDPIHVRDPLAEVLGVVDRDEPVAFHYADLVRAAGHSCPTTAGAFRFAEFGLSALYPDAVPVRGDVSVRVGGPVDETAFGVTGRLLSLVTGATGDDGFGGLPGGFGHRRGLLRYAALDGPGVQVRFSRADDDGVIQVTYDVEAVPRLGEAKELLPAVVDGSADEQAVADFRDAWHRRVDAVLESDDFFSVDRLE